MKNVGMWQRQERMIMNESAPGTNMIEFLMPDEASLYEESHLCRSHAAIASRK
jgi:hypothetical protein